MTESQLSGFMRSMSEQTAQHWHRWPKDNAILMLDGASHPQGWSGFKALWPERSCIGLYQDLPEGASPDFTPFVFAVDPEWLAHKSVHSWLFDDQNTAQGRLCLIWTPLTLEAMANHLKQHVRLRTPERKTALLRFQDPDVLPHALQNMGEEQRQHFLTPVRLLCWTDLDQRWMSVRGAGGDHTPQAQTPWGWSAEQLAQLAQALSPRKILEHLQQEHPDQMTGSQEGWRHKLAGWLGQSPAQGLDTHAARVLYCSLALTVSENFAKVPEVARQLAQENPAEPSKRFIAAIAAVPSHVWDRLAAGQNKPRSAPHPLDSA